MKRGAQGRFVSRGTGRGQADAFVPSPLPPQPPIQLDGELQDRLEGTSRAIGRLDGLAAFLPGADLFRYLFLRKEAVLSARLEGTQVSLPELFLFESGAAPGVPFGGVRPVARLVAAMEGCLDGSPAGTPFALALLEELHAGAAGGGSAGSGGRGGGLGGAGGGARGGRGGGNGGSAPLPKEPAPGSFRGGDLSIPPTHSEIDAFVPAPGAEVAKHMAEFEAFLCDRPRRTPALIKAALAHHHFQSLQPFPEGAAMNGPISRLLILLVLRAEGALSAPLLYPSLHFKENREVYNDHLARVRVEGDWEAWLAFFLEGIERSADHSAHTVRRLVALIDEHRSRIHAIGRAADSTLRVHHQLLRTPILTIPHAGRLLPLTPPTLSASFRKLEELGIAVEVTGRARDRLFTYRKYLDILTEGTEPYPKKDLLARRQAARG